MVNHFLRAKLAFAMNAERATKDRFSTDFIGSQQTIDVQLDSAQH